MGLRRDDPTLPRNPRLRKVRQVSTRSVREAVNLTSVVRRTAVKAIDHDCLNVAQSAAYSAMVALFPALIVTAAIIPLLPYTTPIRFQLAHFFERVLPPDVTPLLETYFAANPKSPQSTRAILLAAFVSLSGASSVIATLMEGFRRAYNLPIDCWGFWQRRARAFLLVPLSILPFGAASLLLVFGQVLTLWLAQHLAQSIRTPIYLLALALRWTIALLGSTGVIALIYHIGTPMRQHWRRTLPGAVVATAMWFLATLLFGWYVTRFANYSQVYGSLGAGIALLFWLYIISLSVLCGAEFNAQYFSEKTLGATAGSAAQDRRDD
jgi:membrane protein